MSNPILIPRCVLELHTIGYQADPGEYRSNLACIYITRSEQVVTDGHQMILLRTELNDRDQQFDRSNGSVMLPNNVAVAMLKGSKKGTKANGPGSIFQLEIHSPISATITRSELCGTKVSIDFDPEGEGSFPDYNQVIPTEDTKQNPKAFGKFWEADQRSIGFNLELTQVVMSYLKRVKANTICGFKFIDPLSPIRSTQEIDCEPYRTEYKDNEKPWYSELTWILMPCRVN